MGARAALALSLAIALAAPAPAQDAAAYGAAFRRAEIRERALGDLEAAVGLYRDAARDAPGPTERARAELRAADCLVRLGRGAEAGELAGPWTGLEVTGIPRDLRVRAREIMAAASAEGPVPTDPETGPEPGEPAVDPASVHELEDELDQVRLRLERSLGETEGARQEAAGARQEADKLVVEVRELEREISALRERRPPPEPESPEEALRLRRELLERTRRKARESAALWTRYAASLHRDGRFAEAREILYDALSRDPENAEAKALLARVAGPLGDRERLHVRIREVLALAREVRLARLTSEADYLLRQGRGLQEKGDVAASVAPLEQALALLTVPRVAERVPDGARSEVELLLRRADAAGFARAPVDSPAPPQLDESWTSALREMLAHAGEEIERGLVLRFHDLDTLLPVESLALPPVPAARPPAGWTLSTRVGDAPGLIAAWLGGTERPALDAPGAALDVEGSTVVALADSSVQERLAERLASAGLVEAAGVDVDVTLLRMAPGAWAERLATLGIDSVDVAGGGRSARLAPADVASLLAAVTGSSDELVAGTFRATHLGPFRLAGGTTARSLSIDVLPIAGDAPGLAVDLRTTWRPAGVGGAAPLRQRALVGAGLEAGGALAVHAVADPATPGRELVLVARLGRAAPEEPGTALEPADPLPRGREAAEHLLPRSVARPEEIPAALLPIPGAPIPSRASALERRLRAAAVGATSVELRGERVLVVGPPDAHDGVRSFLDRLSAVRAPQRFGVEVYVLPRETERELLRTLQSVAPSADASFASAVVSDGRALAAARRILAAGARRVPLTEDVLVTPPTVRHDAAHVVRTPYRADLDTATGEETAWGRAETGVVDQGFLLALRPFGRDSRGRDDVDVSLRLVRVPEVTERERATPLGDVPLLDPRTEAISADLRFALGPRDVLVLADLPSPYSRDDDIRFVLLVTPIR